MVLEKHHRDPVGQRKLLGLWDTEYSFERLRRRRNRHTGIDRTVLRHPSNARAIKENETCRTVCLLGSLVSGQMASSVRIEHALADLTTDSLVKGVYRRSSPM